MPISPQDAKPTEDEPGDLPIVPARPKDGGGLGEWETNARNLYRDLWDSINLMRHHHMMVPLFYDDDDDSEGSTTPDSAWYAKDRMREIKNHLKDISDAMYGGKQGLSSWKGPSSKTFSGVFDDISTWLGSLQTTLQSYEPILDDIGWYHQRAKIRAKEISHNLWVDLSHLYAAYNVVNIGHWLDVNRKFDKEPTWKQWAGVSTYDAPTYEAPTFELPDFIELNPPSGELGMPSGMPNALSGMPSDMPTGGSDALSGMPLGGGLDGLSGSPLGSPLSGDQGSSGVLPAGMPLVTGPDGQIGADVTGDGRPDIGVNDRALSGGGLPSGSKVVTKKPDGTAGFDLDGDGIAVTNPQLMPYPDSPYFQRQLPPPLEGGTSGGVPGVGPGGASGESSAGLEPGGQAVRSPGGASASGAGDGGAGAGGMGYPPMMPSMMGGMGGGMGGGGGGQEKNEWERRR